MSTPLYGITGATGQIGGLVARELASAGKAQRLLVRAESLSRAPKLAGAHAASSSYGDPKAALAALKQRRGVAHGLGLGERGSLSINIARSSTPCGEGSRTARRVHRLFLGAAENSTFTLGRDHFATEAHLRASGMAFTFLRDSFYLDVLPMFAGPDGVIRGPAGNGVVGAVARADVARVAVTVLSNPGARRQAVPYNLIDGQRGALLRRRRSRRHGRDREAHDVLRRDDGRGLRFTRALRRAEMASR